MPKTKWSEIWREIAEAYDTPEVYRTRRQKHLHSTGLCISLRSSGVGIVAVRKFIKTFKPEWSSAYWWPLGKKGDGYRALFAGFMSAMGDRAFEKLINPKKKKAVNVYKN